MEMRYSKLKNDSKFSQLAGHYKRGIEEQAFIEVEANKISNYNRKKYENDEECQKLFDKICEKYAQNENKVKELYIKSNKRLYLFPMEKDREQYYKELISEEAKRIDERMKFILDNSRSR